MLETGSLVQDTQSTEASVAQPRKKTEVFAVLGADPEVQAYAMAKYSRAPFP